jgi:hypothetical protein
MAAAKIINVLDRASARRKILKNRGNNNGDRADISGEDGTG